MMKNTLKFILVAFCLLTIVSCSTVNHTYRSVGVDKTNIVTNDVVVDVDVDLNNKINETSSKRKTIKEAKNEVYYKAIANNNIDVVVDPIFEVTTHAKILFFGGKTTAKLSGFGGKYVNSRTKIDVIKELNIIDTLDIKKFDVIFNNGSFFKDKSGSSVVLKSGNKKEVAKKRTVKKTEQPSLLTNNTSKFGVKAAYASNTISEYDEENNGYGVGFFIESDISRKMAVRGELLFSSNDISNNINMPILLKYKLSRKFSILSGPSITFNMNPKEDYIDVDLYREDVSKFNLGLDFGLSFDITKKISIETRSSLGLTDSNFRQSYMGVSYRFK